LLKVQRDTRWTQHHTHLGDERITAPSQKEGLVPLSPALFSQPTCKYGV
jgi:hypothetical protein